MIWHYFPIGMRFPVTDFSDETKRACWNVALSAAFASDACGTTLYEAMEPLDPGSFGAVYTCIVCYVGIKQSRLAGKTMHSLDGLKTRLCLNDPLSGALRSVFAARRDRRNRSYYRDRCGKRISSNGGDPSDASKRRP